MPTTLSDALSDPHCRQQWPVQRTPGQKRSADRLWVEDKAATASRTITAVTTTTTVATTQAAAARTRDDCGSTNHQ